MILVPPSKKPVGFYVLFNGAKKPVSIPFRVPSGKHTVIAGAPGHKRWRKRFTVRAEILTEIKIPELPRKEASEQTRVLVIPPTSLPSGFYVSLDGEKLSPGTLEEPVAVKPGKHTVIVGAPGHKRWRKRFTARVGDLIEVRVPTLPRK